MALQGLPEGGELVPELAPWPGRPEPRDRGSPPRGPGPWLAPRPPGPWRPPRRASPRASWRTFSRRWLSRPRSWMRALRHRVRSRSSRISDQPVLHQLGDSGRVGHVGLAPGDVLEVGGVEQPALEVGLEQVLHGPPVHPGGLHPHHGDPKLAIQSRRARGSAVVMAKVGSRRGADPRSSSRPEALRLRESATREPPRGQADRGGVGRWRNSVTTSHGDLRRARLFGA